jgi:hypothetical protein
VVIIVYKNISTPRAGELFQQLIGILLAARLISSLSQR